MGRFTSATTASSHTLWVPAPFQFSFGLEDWMKGSVREGLISFHPAVRAHLANELAYLVSSIQGLLCGRSLT